MASVRLLGILVCIKLVSILILVMPILFQEQIAILHELLWYLEHTEFETLNWWQTGMIITIKSFIQLQDYMYKKLGLPYLLGKSVDQDYHEGFNGQMRLSTGKGGVRNPTHLELNYRIQHWVTGKILEDKNFRIFELEPILIKYLELPKQKEKIRFITIPRKLKESAADGMFWAAGFIAFRMKEVQPELGTLEKYATDDHAKNTFFSLMNHGGAQVPTNVFLKDYHKMESLFQSYHPKFSIRPGRGLTSNFFIKLKKEFSYYKDPVLRMVTKVLTSFRMKALNNYHKKKNRKRGSKKRGEVTPRGRRKTVDFSMPR